MIAYVISDLLLTYHCGFKVIDCYGNHVEKGCKVFLELKGLQLQDGQELERTVHSHNFSIL